MNSLKKYCEFPYLVCVPVDSINKGRRHHDTNFQLVKMYTHFSRNLGTVDLYYSFV